MAEGQQTEGEATEETEEEEEELSKEANKALYEAQELIKEDDFAGARQKLLDFVATEPEKIPVILYEMLGFVYSQEDNMEGAREAFKSGHELDPDSENILRNYAIASLQTERFEEAAVLFEKLFDMMEQKDSKILQHAAMSWYQVENLDEAKRLLLRLFDLPEEPKPDWFKLIINICVELEQMAEAEDWIRQFLRLDPMQAEYWNLLAQMMLDKDDYRGAAGALEISYAVKAPSRGRQWEVLADIYAYLNALLKAAGSLEVALKGKTPDDKYLVLVDAYSRAHRFDTALARIDQLIAVAPTARLYMQKGNLLYDAGRVKAGIQAWDGCIDLDARNDECLFAKGLAQWDLRRWDDAQKTFSDAARVEGKYQLQAEDAIAILDDLESAKYDPNFDFRKGR